MTGEAYGSISKLECLLTNGLKKLTLIPSSYASEGISKRNLDCSLLAKATKCIELDFRYVTVSNMDGKYIPNTVKNLTFSNCKLTNFRNLKMLTELRELTLDSNLFASLSDFYELPEDCSLTTLNLSNNSLQNYSSFSVSGLSNTYKTCDILAKFENLTSIDLSENLDLTDFSSLTSSGSGFIAYKDDGKHLFTRTLN